MSLARAFLARGLLGGPTGAIIAQYQLGPLGIQVVPVPPPVTSTGGGLSIRPGFEIPRNKDYYERDDEQDEKKKVQIVIKLGYRQVSKIYELDDLRVKVVVKGLKLAQRVHEALVRIRMVEHKYVIGIRKRIWNK